MSISTPENRSTGRDSRVIASRLFRRAGKTILGALVAMGMTPFESGYAQFSTARFWNERTLDAIRIDFPAPTTHARNLLHVSAGMYDAWAAYDPVAIGYFHNEIATAGDVALARREAVSYAAYRVLSHRYAFAVDPVTSQASFDALLAALGYDKNVTTLVGNTPAAVGNRCAAAVIAFGATDGANETNNYDDTTGYAPLNNPLALFTLQNEPRSGVSDLEGNPLLEPNHWQPLAFQTRFTQNGLVADKIQTFVGPHWGYVAPFGLRGAWHDGVWAMCDPGMPPLFGGIGDAEFKANSVDVVRYSARLDPDNGEMIDVSPGGPGKNNTLGQHDGTGHPVNPVTGLPYTPVMVKHGDYGRVVAEFWADGPHSETPPGHWNTLANFVADTPGFERRIGGTGPIVDPLEWDVKMYFALNAAVHDVAVATWGIKAYYDYVRPITSIRYMGGLGQSSDPLKDAYHAGGLPLEDGLVELITTDTTMAGERHEHLAGHEGEIAIYCWPGEPEFPETQFSGTAWILAEDWLPYQRDTFVTPAFAGYTSGHSGFSRAAAEVLTAMTGSEFFPGGLGSYTIPAGAMEFELGPSTHIPLQWATYYDASDEAGISRIYGGIHVAPDDGPGRIIGSKIGKLAWGFGRRFFTGEVMDDFIEPTIQWVTHEGLPKIELSWPCVGGYQYKIIRSSNLVTFTDETAFAELGTGTAYYRFENPMGAAFFKVVRLDP